MKVYRYEHVDSFALSNKESYELFKDWQDYRLSNKQIKSKYYREKLKVARLFRQAGWEGDGRIGLIWIPPFVIKNSDTWGELVWHVKQRNNGSSFIAVSNHSNITIF